MAGKTYRITKIAISLLTLLLLFSTTAYPKIIYVDDLGPADFDNIQAAIDDSGHGDTIIVSPGTYTGAGNRDISFNGKAITVRSEDPNDPNIVAATIINCNGTEDQPHRGFLFNSGEEANSVLAGLTITNGYADYGGGINCEGSRPTITNCNIVGNEALLGGIRRGGGISCRFCNLKGPSLPGKAFDPYPSDGATHISLTHSLRWMAGFLAESHDVYFGTTSPPPFIGNQTSTTFDPGTMEPYTTYYWRIDELNTLGKTIGDQWSFTTGSEPPPPPPPPPPGAFREQSSPRILSETNLSGPKISNCIFIDNGAEEGGGMYTQNSKPMLENCTFDDNKAGDGGGMFTDRSDPALFNCTFIGNSSSMGGGLLCTDGNTILTNCIFIENSSSFGGGVLNSYDSNTTLTDCIFNDNSARFSGGGIYNDANSRTNLTNCTFTGNSVLFKDIINEGGGGICNRHCNSRLTKCSFSKNSANRGGGIFNFGYTTNTVLIDCIFNENSADIGGGMFSGGSSDILINCMFSGNSASEKGGGMCNDECRSTLKNCTFIGNMVEYFAGSIIIFPPYFKYVYGGGMCNENCNPILINCSFSGNSVTSFLGPYYSYPVYCFGGAMYNNQSGAKVINCTFTGNLASDEGGAIRWQHTDLPSPPLPPFPPPFPYLANSAITSGGLAENLSITDYNDSNVPMISNCIFWDNRDSNGADESAQISVDPNETTIIINYSCIQGWTGDLGGTGNIYADPCFVQSGFWIPDIYIFQDWFEGYYQLMPESLCIDAGDPNYIAKPNETDLDGNPRVFGGRIDIGAYEYQGPRDPCVFYVDDDAMGANNGSSWGDAFNFLQDALTEAQYGDTILVAQGTYKPDSCRMAMRGDRGATFRLKNGLAVIGGYAGANATDSNARSIGLYKTILSGDLDGNDVEVFDPCDFWHEPTRFDNAATVVSGSGTNATAVLDGFTITAGQFCGMENIYGSLTINNCRFIENGAITFSTAMFNSFSSPVITNCTFERNWGCWGGGMINLQSNPVLLGCNFTGNYSNELGGGLYNRLSNPILTNCIFNGNLSFEEAGAMYNHRSSPILNNCLFSGNVASENGGCMCNYYNSNPMLTNCTLSDNRAGTYGGGIYNEGSDANLTNCILWGDSAAQGNEIYLARYIDYLGDQSTMDVNYSDIMGGYTNVYVDAGCTLNWGLGNIDTDPYFVRRGYWGPNIPPIPPPAPQTPPPTPPFSAYTDDVPQYIWFEGDYNLLPSSPCIDTGNPNYVSEPGETDLNGNSRILDGDNDGVPVVDMGAYEYVSPIPLAEAGPDQIIECACNTEEGTKVTLDGTGSYDLGGRPLTFTWTGPFVESPANGATPTVTLEDGCPGEYVITLIVNNGIEDSEPNDVVITVVDTTPPEFSLSVSPAVLWPPDHKMYEITPSWTVSDECDALPDVSLVGIVISEGGDAIGDGHTGDDIQIGEDGSIYLRAERSGTGSDRIYTIICQAVDDGGNVTVRSATVSIPHDFKVLAGIAAKWLWANPSGRIPEDFNSDGVVNFTDFATFAENWIK